MVGELLMRYVAILLLAAAIAPATPAQSPILAPGARVRIAAQGVTIRPIEATIVSIAPDTIIVMDDQNIGPLTVPRTAITTLEMTVGGEGWRGFKKGVRIGTEWGIGTGIAIAALGHETCGRPVAPKNGCTFAMRLQTVTALTGVGAFYGAIVGFVVGSEEWGKVELPARTTVGVRDGRPALSLSLNF
jgi:hypothetical protein